MMEPNTTDSDTTPWFTVCGESRPELTRRLRERVEQRRASGAFHREMEKGVEAATFVVSRGDFSTSAARLEMLRKLCQIYAVELQPSEITSHRKVIGPLIVGGKKILYRLVKPLVGKALEQQRNFNAQVIYLLADLCNEEEARRSDT